MFNMTRLFLIRHGQTDWNLQGRWQGHYDEPLNAQGVRESKLVAQRFERETTAFSAVFCSDLQRAKQTAQGLADQLELPLHVLPELREIDVGYWSGLTHKDITEKYPHELNLVETGHDVPRGGGETRTQFHNRISTALNEMRRLYANHNILVITHGGCIRAMLTLTHTNPNPGQHSVSNGITIANGSVSILIHEEKPHADDHEKKSWSLEKLNDTTHLTLATGDATNTSNGLNQGEAQMTQAVDMLAPITPGRVQN